MLREPISPAERLPLTIRFLASGSSLTSMSFTYRVGRTTVSNIIRETCCALWEALHEKYFKALRSHDAWKNISEEFTKLWNFPNCIGFICAKHIAIRQFHLLTYVHRHTGSEILGGWTLVCLTSAEPNLISPRSLSRVLY